MSNMTTTETAAPRLLTVKAAAKQLSVSEVWVRRQIANGHLASVKLGTRVLIPEAALVALIERHLRPAGEVVA